MKKLNFKKAPLEGAWIVETIPHIDERGQMVRAFCREEFAGMGIDFELAQGNISTNERAGTLRGMHCQVEPMGKSKLVRCIRGAVYDVIVDMREESPTYRQHFGMELSAANQKMLVIPKCFSHGFLTLEDDSELFYMVNNFYTPEYGRGLRFDDPVLDIKWPRSIEYISEQDKNWPLLLREQ